MGVTALIPAFNVERTIAATIAALRRMPEIEKIVVVDDGSGDATAAIARDAGALVLTHQRNQGKGAALNTGFLAIKDQAPAALALVDADLGDSAAGFALLIAPVLKGEAEMTIARFPKAKRRGGFGVAKNFCRFGLHAFTGQWFESPMSGQRVLASAVIKDMRGFAAGWGCEPALTIDVHRAGGRILEIPVPMTHAETGRNLRGFIHRGRQLLAAAGVFINRTFNRRS